MSGIGYVYAFVEDPSNVSNNRVFHVGSTLSIDTFMLHFVNGYFNNANSSNGTDSQRFQNYFGDSGQFSVGLYRYINDRVGTVHFDIYLVNTFAAVEGVDHLNFLESKFIQKLQSVGYQLFVDDDKYLPFRTLSQSEESLIDDASSAFISRVSSVTSSDQKLFTSLELLINRLHSEAIDHHINDLNHSYHTQTLSAEGMNAELRNTIAAPSAYVTYNANTYLNLNFLFREVLLCDPKYVSAQFDDDEEDHEYTGSSKVHIVKTYPTDISASQDDDEDRIADMATSLGSAICIRLINAMTNSVNVHSERHILVNTNLHSYFGGYMHGIVSSRSVNTGDYMSSTMDFSEFMQVGISATYNAESDALTTANNGLKDRESVNSMAVVEDFRKMSTEDLDKSRLLGAMLTSSTKPNVYAEQGTIDLLSDVNWMKQLVYSILLQSSTAKHPRFRSIRRNLIHDPKGNHDERFLQLQLKNGDAVVFVFSFMISNEDGTVVDQRQPDNPDELITVGFKVVHSDIGGDFSDTYTDTGKGPGSGTIPVGWTCSCD